MKVLKYPVPIDGNWHEIGVGKPVLVGQVEYSDEPFVWVEVDEGHNNMGELFGIETKQFARVFATGEDIPSLLEHAGSFMNFPYVWHIYTHKVTGSKKES